MNSGLNVDDPAVVAAFRSALLHQGLLALLVFGVIGATWGSLRAWRHARAGAPDPARTVAREPSGRLALVIGFGNLWLFDGFLQAQPKMAIGLPSQVIEPTAASSPLWVQHMVNWAATAWSYHPVQAAVAAVWIQVGLGVWILAAPRGTPSRLAGLVSAGWGLVVWIFGESFGGILAPGLSWLTGAPGAAGLYLAAGVLIALPDRAWRSPRLGQLTLAGLGLFLAGMAVLQAWPGRGSWQGVSHGQPGTLAGMALSMSLTPQPGFLAGWVSWFGTVDQAHGFAVNLLVVITLGVTGTAFLSGRPRLIRPVLIAFTFVCLADWVLVQDLGFLGGLGTDPNSMIPFVLLAAGGYLALTQATAGRDEQAARRAEQAAQVHARARWPAWAWPGRSPTRTWPAGMVQRALEASSRSVVALAGAGLIVLGVAPMAAAQASPDADPLLAQSIAGGSAAADYPAPGFTLADQNRQAVTLASLRGKAVLLSFLDPDCTTDCPPIGAQFRQAAQLLGARSDQVELVEIETSEAGRSAHAGPAFGQQEGLSRLPGWLLLTGTPAQLRRVGQEYGIAGETARQNAPVYVIDPAGRVRREFRHDPGPGTAATSSSFAVLFADATRQALSAG
jgi:cytochrome oxidase Cu insertion factor (SCO1/SenC/PrrC family)